MGFALMSGFIGLFDTAREYTFQFTISHTLVSTVTPSLPLLGSGFQRWTFPFLLVPEIFPYVTYQLPPPTAPHD
jgi:hypothetical protein